MNRQEIEKTLDDSLSDNDFFCCETRRRLKEQGMADEESLIRLAIHKSKHKYNYHLSRDSAPHILKLCREKESRGKKIFESPFFLMKACWLYEHAPFFFYYGRDASESRDALIMDFVQKFEAQNLENKVDIDSWGMNPNPWRVGITTFWESRIIDPVLLIQNAKNNQFEGIELSIDFHPFNYSRLLPEEFLPEKREQIKKACLKSGIKIDLHSPIVGPYAPSPDPAKGSQLFFDPTRCPRVQAETIQLAKDIAAGNVVFHLIDTSNLKGLANLVELAGGSDVRVTLENFCQTKERQTADTFIACMQEIFSSLSRENRKKNFGINLDVGHFNIEGEDPLVASEKIGRWCLQNKVYLRMHATDNYGKLLFSPPAYSADVHSNVSGRGINNASIIKLLRSMGLEFDIIAEQIQPLTAADIAIIHDAQTTRLEESFDRLAARGRKVLSSQIAESLITPEISANNAYAFLTGLEGISALREYLVYRKIQVKKNLSVDEAKKISQDFMKMPHKFKTDLVDYVDELLLPVQSEHGAIQKSEIDLICENISGALFGTINNEHLNQIFSRTRTYNKGDVICKQDTLSTEIYFIKKGQVSVIIDGAPVAALGPGEIFGEIGLFYNIHRSATILADEDTTLVGVLSRKGLEQVFKTSQPYAYDLIFRLFNTLPERLRNLNDKYITTIRSLHLIFDGDENRMPYIDDAAFFNEAEPTLLSELSEKEAGAIFPEVRTLEPNQVIFSEGDPGDGAYLIMQGRVQVQGKEGNPKPIVLGELSAGEIFGEMALIDNKPRSASIVTLTPCEIAFIPRESFNKLIKSCSGLAFRMMGVICLLLFRRILRLDSLYSEVKKRIRAQQ